MTFRDFLLYQYANNTAFVISLLILTPVQLGFAIKSLLYVNQIGVVNFWNCAKLIPLLCNIICASVMVYKHPKNRLNRFVLLGLIFGLVGDYFLILNGTFIAGIAGFAVGHLCYILAFTLPPFPESPPVDTNYFRGIPFLCGFLAIPTPVIVHMGRTGGSIILMVAISIYSGIIMTMGWRAASRIGYGNGNENRWFQFLALLAGLIFASSDSMIAYNNFYIHVPHSDILILSTYWVAQYLFLLSLLRTKSDYEQIEGINN